MFPCALSNDARQSWVQASCTHSSVSLPFLTMNRQRLLLGPHYPTSFASKLCFPGLLEGTAPTPPLDSAQKRRCCQQDSWEDTLAQTLVGFKCFATPLVPGFKKPGTSQMSEGPWAEKFSTQPLCSGASGAVEVWFWHPCLFAGSSSCSAAPC